MEPWGTAQHWTVAKLRRKHPSQPFNPDVANVFFRAGMIEAWGRGIERIMEACRAAQVPAPKLRYQPSGLWVEFRYAPTPVPGAQAGTGAREETREVTREEIVRLLAAQRLMTTDQLAHQLGITRKGVEWHIVRLKAAGRLKRVGPTKGGHWEVLS